MPATAVANPLADLFGFSSDAAPVAAFDEEKTVDPDTLATWSDIVSTDTENIGRIWTDKTVSLSSVQLPASPDGAAPSVDIGNSDFLVTLSALSSTSNTTTTSSKPLDIVLVLDASGSMGDELTSEYRYNEAYDINTNGRTTYYARNADGSYAEIERVTKTVLFWQEFDHWELDGQTVNPKTSAQDSDPGHIQFYTYDEVTTTKMAALHDAANAFIENTATQNDAIDDAAKQHRISLVKFASDKSNTVGNNTNGSGYNYSQVVTNLTVYTSDDVALATSMVNGLTASGATSADYGMQHAQTVLASAREDAQKVVIFFTDGEPNHQNGFDGTVANDAISAAGALKDENTLVYTIGMFADADPSNTSTSTTNRFNAYMHAVSSNYPKATAWNSLGDRVSQGSAYYKAATNAAELNQIFQEISDEINAGAGYPTETTEGAEGTSGYITFTDELGAYMEVDSFKSIVFADKVFSNPVKSTNGLTDTYTFEGEGGNALYPSGNLNQIDVTVQRSDELAQGDIVTVKVPASLIPLRSFTVADENGAATMDIAEAYPMRIFYGVSVKQGVYDALVQGTADQALKNYIAANTVDGKISFYSNYYDGTVTSGGKKLGNTTASFVPAEGNSFYYFTQNTTLYTDENCTQKLMTEPHAGDTYYYKRAYYAKDAQSGEVTKKDSITRFVGANFSASTTFWGKANDGSYYIKAGAPRLTRIDDLTLAKESNVTGTSTEVINPNWDNINNPDVLNVSLGNNGKIAVELPGTLAIAKDAGIAPNKGLSIDVLNGKEFQFEITVDGAANKTYKAEVKHEDGTVTGALFDLAFDGQGKASHSIKDNETLYIYGLDAGAAYTVTESEDKLPAGFTQTSATGDAGAIPGNATAQAKFVNTYDVAPVTLSAADFATYQKNFDRWDIASSFSILLTEDNAANPMPEGSAEGANGLEEKTVQVSEGATSGNFGDITFDRAGTFTYTITEPAASSAVLGITYSQAAYSVTVTVTDKSDGTLEATSTMKRVSSDTGAGVDEAVDDKNAVFTNSFDVASVNIGPRAAKVYTNNGGADMNLAVGMFTFKVTAVGGNAADAPMPEGEQTDDQGSRFVTVVNDGPEVAFGQATFTDKHVGRTYTYEIREVLPDGATAENGYTVNGMTYDNSYYTVTFTVSSEVVEGKATVKVERSYTKGDEATAVAGDPTFTNSYDPADVTLEGDTAIAASKTLVGRDSQIDEIFGFMLVARGNATQNALKNHEIVFNGNNDTTKLEASVYGLTNGQAKAASFGSIAFTKPGTYSFDVTEKVPASDADGMVYDRSTKTVTVTVTDDNGTLKASVSYPGGASAAAFTNTYASSYIYGTGMKLDAVKTLDGRAQKAGEFSFAIKGVDKSGSVAAAEAEGKLAESDKSFSTIAGAPDGVQSKMFNLLSGVKFSQDDAGKTFSYELAEVEGSLAGVTYDKAVYAIDITPIDNADATMRAKTTIYKKNVDGTTELVGEYDSASGVGAATLGFTNTYKAASVTVDPATTPIDLSKVLTGRDWKASDSFEFTLTSADAGSPSFDVATKIVTHAEGTPAGTEVPFNFGSATFDAPGHYHYTVTETNGGKTIDGVTYDGHTADIYVIVDDPGNGQLTAQVNVYNGTFTNDYKAELNHNDAGGIVVTKTTNGHDMARGQFQFRVEALDGDGVTAVETAQRIGITDGTTGDFGNIEGADGEKVEMPSEHPIAFTQADVGKTFKLKISERGADGITFGSGGTVDGYTYSDAVYTVELSVADKGDGALELTTKVTDKDGKTTEQTNSAADAQATYLDFVNAYEAVVPADRPVTTENLFSKVLNGRDWKASDSFTFTITPQGDAPAPERANVTLTGLTVAAGSHADFGFGKINFTFDDVKDVAPAADGTRTKNFVYKVTENVPAGDDKIAGIDYDTREVTLTVTLTDDGKGNLAASYNVANGPFVNTYESGAVSVDAAGGVQVVKTLTGRAIAAGDFAFTMTATSDDAKAKFGEAKTAQTAGAPLGTGADANTAVETVKVATGLTFGLEDVGKNFAFDVVETKGGGTGYVNDATVHKLTFEVFDDGAGTLEVVANLDDEVAATWTNAATRAMGDAVSIPFVNRYDAGFVTVGGDGDVALAGVKQLIGRDMVAGEFHFNVTNAADDAKRVVATGVNALDGTVSFTGVTYTTEQLNKDVAAGLATVVRADDADVYTYDYNVSEDASKNAAGITVIQGAQAIKVKVTDDHEGKLSAEVVYPDGGMVFRNAYGAGAEARISLVGAKVLEVESGDNAPDITGKYTFTLTGSEGAPMPAKNAAVNEASGGVSFGEMSYTIDCLEGAEVAADGTRSKTFTYTVNESGGVAGVVNDAIAKTIEVTVKDNGDGTMSAVKSTVGDAADFTFVNVYRVEPTESSLTGEGGFDITKTLTGRDMRAGEFEFSLEAADGTAVVASNDASGKVVFPVMRFTEPGTYKYVLAEVDGELGGVTYDDAVYEAVARVIDKGDGTLGVTWSVSKDGELLDGKDVVFANTYLAEPASISLGAAKKLTGRDIVEGEFSFELRDVAGNVLQAVTNGAAEDGVAPVVFAPIVYDAPGEYDYRVAEVVGDAEGVTYDETVFAFHVSVTDDGAGHLEATLAQDDAGALVFENVYVAPPAPEDPATPVEPPKTVPALVKTGDTVPALMMALGAAAAVAAAVAAVGLRRLRSRRG